MEARDSKIIKMWLSSITTSKNTVRNYTIALKFFCELIGKTPNELLEEAESEVRAGMLMRERNIKAYLIDYKNTLQGKGLAPITVKNYMAGVISFYKNNDIEIPNLPKIKGRPLEKHRDTPTKEDLQHVVKVCTLLEKAVVLIGVSSGLSANEILNLKVRDFKSGYCEADHITTLKLRREKVQYDFITFLSPEASSAVQDYLNYRNREIETGTTKRKNQLYKQKVFNANDYLFIIQKVPNSFLSTMNDSERKISHAAFMKIYQGISEKTQKESPKWDWNLIRSHNMRKYFNSALLNAGADSFLTEYLMGHTVDSTKTAYFRASADKLKEQYKKYIPYLTIQKELDISESEDFKRLKSDNEALLIEAEKYRVEQTELQDLWNEVDKLVVAISSIAKKE
jgi:integrase